MKKFATLLLAMLTVCISAFMPMAAYADDALSGNPPAPNTESFGAGASMLVDIFAFEAQTNMEKEMWSWNKDTQTLTLKNYIGNRIDIETKNNNSIVNIVLLGENIITPTSAAVGINTHSSSAIYCDASLKFTGTGSITFTTNASNYDMINAVNITIDGPTMKGTGFTKGLKAKNITLKNSNYTFEDVVDIVAHLPHIFECTESFTADSINVSASYSEAPVTSKESWIVWSLGNISISNASFTLDKAYHGIASTGDVALKDTTITGVCEQTLLQGKNMQVSKCAINVKSDLPTESSIGSKGFVALKKVDIAKSNVIISTSSTVCTCESASIADSTIDFKSTGDKVFNMGAEYKIYLPYASAKVTAVTINGTTLPECPTVIDTTTPLDFSTFTIKNDHTCKLAYFDDNKDGTHTKTCIDCERQEVEEHRFVNGECPCGVKESTNSPATNAPVNINIPQTGSSSELTVLLFIVILTSAAAITAIYVFKKKKAK